MDNLVIVVRMEAVIIALASGVVWKAGQFAKEAERASRHAAEAGVQAERARAATARAEAELWNTRLAGARATRSAGGPGAREKAATVIASLARQPGLDETQTLALRPEAVTHLALLDVELPAGWPLPRSPGRPVWDAAYQRRVNSSGTNRLEIVDAASGKSLQTLDGPAGVYHYEVTFSPDGNYLAGLFNPNSPFVLAWRIPDGALILSNRISDSVIPLFSPDSRLLAMKTARGMELQSLQTNLSARLLPAGHNACFSPDARMMAFTHGTNAEIHRIETGAVLHRLEIPFRATMVAWSSDRTRLALSGREGELAMWELPQTNAPPPGQLRFLAGHTTTIVGLAFSPDGRLLLSEGWDGVTSFWEVKSGRRLLAETRAMVNSFSTDGSRLTAKGREMNVRSPVRLLNRTGFRTVAQAARTPRLPMGMTFSRDGKYLATDHHDVICLFEAGSGRELARLAGRSPVFSPDGKSLFACTDGAVFRFEVSAAAVRSEVLTNTPGGVEILRRDRVRHPQERFNTLSLAPDDRTLVVSASEAGVVLLDLPGEREIRRLTKAAAHFATLSADGAWLETRFHNGHAHLTSLTNTAKPVLLGTHLNMAFSPDANWLAVSSGAVLSLMQRNVSNRWVRTARVPLDLGAGEPAALVFHPDNRSVAVVHNRFDIRLYDVATARELATFIAPTAAAIVGFSSLGFSPDGRFLRAVRGDGEVIEWDIPVVRAELTKLGLDWSDAPGALASITATTAAIAGAGVRPALATLTSPGSSAVLAAVAGVLALAAGIFVFLHQRRLLAAHARAEELVAERQEQLAHAQHALFQSQKLEALGTLAAGVAHDFNNLLSVIRMSNQLVERAVQPEGVMKENVQAIEHAVQQGKSIVNSMLGYSRRPTEVIENFSVDRTVNETVALLSRQFLSGLTLQLELDPTCPTICGSRLRLEQALLNLIVNASEAMRGQGRLTISTRLIDRAPDLVLAAKPSSGFVEVSVSDSGPGIAPAALPRIFEPFFTTKTAGTERGTGLGLSLVYAIALQDGWGLDVKSETGRGATFRLVLPISQTEFMGRPRPAARAAESAGKVSSA